MMSIRGIMSDIKRKNKLEEKIRRRRKEGRKKEWKKQTNKE